MMWLRTALLVAAAAATTADPPPARKATATTRPPETPAAATATTRPSTDGPTPSRAHTSPATSAVSVGPPRTDVAPPGRTRVRMVVSERSRNTQFCIGELVFVDSTGRDVAASKAAASSPRTQKGFEPALLTDGRLHHDFCSAEPTGWVSLEVAVPLRELAAYRVGSDCGEDTPMDWTIEACHIDTSAMHGEATTGISACAHDDPKKWETLDVRTDERWNKGCQGEWRDFSIQRWRVLRISAGMQDWCLDALRVTGAGGRPLRIASARPVAAPGATQTVSMADIAHRAPKITRVLGIGGPPSEGAPWCSSDALGDFEPSVATFCADVVAEKRHCSHVAKDLGKRDTADACARATHLDDACSGSRFEFDADTQACACCATAALKPGVNLRWDTQATAVYEYNYCAALVVDLQPDGRVPVVAVRIRRPQNDAPAPSRLRVDGCLWDRSPETGQRLPFGGCRTWKRLATDAKVEYQADGWGLLSLPGGVAVTKAPPPPAFFDELVHSPGVGMSRGPGQAAPRAVAVDLGDHVWETEADGVKLRRIKLTQAHLHDMSQLSSGRVVSATFGRNVSGDSLLGRSRGDSNVINIRM